MSVVSLDDYRNKPRGRDMFPGAPGMDGFGDGVSSDAFDDDDLATESEADLALQLADAQSRIAELELVLVETLKRNALNWARAQEAEAKISALEKQLDLPPSET